MFFRVLYTVFLVVCFLYPFEYVIGPVALRHIIALFVLIWLLVNKKFKFDKVLWIFAIYLFCFLFSSLITGYVVSFIPTLVGTYILCMIMYQATKVMMENDGGKWILYSLLSIALVDSVVTIAQFFNHPLAQSIANILRVSLIDEEAWDTYDRYGGAKGGLTAGGLLRGVKNGYFLCSAVIFSLINKSGHKKLINYFICLFLLIALFVAQERAAMFLGILCITCYLIIGVNRGSSKKNLKLLTVFAVVLLALYFSDIGSFVDFSATRYSMLGNETDGREIFWARAFDFVGNNPLGGSYLFYDNGGYPPHNFIPNSYLNGGIFGGTLIVALVIVQVYICIKILFEAFTKKKHSMLVVALALIYLGYTGNSCFHNLSLSMGDEVAFIWWAILAVLLDQEKKEKKNDIVSKVLLNNKAEFGYTLQNNN